VEGDGGAYPLEEGGLLRRKRAAGACAGDVWVRGGVSGNNCYDYGNSKNQML
jgi:hypothetical protein